MSIRTKRNHRSRHSRTRRDNWITEEQVELEYDVPREVLTQMTDDPTIEVSTDSVDRSIRRRFILGYWARVAGENGFWRAPPEMVPELFGKDLTEIQRRHRRRDGFSDLEPKMPHCQRLLAANAWMHLVSIDFRAGNLKWSDEHGVYGFLDSDIQEGPPSKAELRDERKRYYSSPPM